MAINIGGGIAIGGNLVNNADTDTYTVFMREGEVYDFWMGPELSSLNSVDDTFITLAGPSAGLPINDDNDGEGPGGAATEGNATLTFRATATGLHTLTVAEVSGNGNGGDYELTIVNRSFDDDIADHTFFTDETGGIGGGATIEQVGTNSAINVGDVFHSDLERLNRVNDVDIVAVFLEGNGNPVTGNTYTFDMRAFDTGDGTLANPHLDLLDADGTVLLSDANSGDGNNARIAAFDPDTALGTGWYFLKADWDVSTAGVTQTYELQVTSTGGAEDVPGADSSPFNVPLNGAVEGNISPAGDEDWYAINLVAGATYHFAASRVTLTGSIELELIDDDGNVVELNDSDPTTAEFDFTVTAGDSGRFFAVVRGDTGLETGTYQLSATLVSALPVPVHTITAVDDPFILGSDLADSITGSPGDDNIEGALGDDTLAGGLGADFIGGGSIPGSGNDSLLGEAGDDTLAGLDGDDTADGGEDDDSVLGGNGANSLLGGTGNDNLNAGSSTDASSNTVEGGDGNDTIVGSVGAADLLTGGLGNDAITSGGTGDTLLGGDGNDFLNTVGTPGGTSLDGGIGNDTLFGGNGSDTEIGGEGDDQLLGFNGVDLLNGGNGNDTIGDVGIDGLADNVTAGAGVDQVNSFIGWTLDLDEENLTLLGVTNINGNGNTGGNVIFGSNGANQLSGLGGNDTVNGGAGNDTLIGGFGKDLNTGGAGLDVIRFNSLGESGTTFATRDAINTFAHGDKIDLSAIDANTRFAGNQAFTFVASQTLTGQTGIVIAQQVATNSFLVLADINGDAHADFSLNVYTSPGFGNFAGFDFIL